MLKSYPGYAQDVQRHIGDQLWIGVNRQRTKHARTKHRKSHVKYFVLLPIINFFPPSSLFFSLHEQLGNMNSFCFEDYMCLVVSGHYARETVSPTVLYPLANNGQKRVTERVQYKC